MFEPSKIPGMIEPGEQALLERLAGEAGGQGAIVEFGSFFGRSTACLVNGAARWWSPGQEPAVAAYDSFGCAEQGAFAGHVGAFARRAGVEGLVRRAGGRIDFYPVFQRYVGEAEAAGLLRTTVGELRDAAWPGGPIALMHVDAPKFYEEMKYLLVRFFPSLAPGGAVVFQDYLYHWSATLIASVQLLAEAGLIRFEESAATAVVARVLRAPTAEELLEIDLAMATTPAAALIDRAIAGIDAIPVDRAEQFVPRLHLAKMQWLWERGEFAAAQKAFAGMIQGSGGRLAGTVFADLQELLSYGFSLRRLYELDH